MSSSNVIVLIDVNAFYVSCQALFQPWLKGLPVVVASNQDGCVVSRSDSAKALGVKMGQPLFELQELTRKGQLIVFSSNYALYQSLSNRIMAVIEELSQITFPYSLDEAFCSLDGVADPEQWARDTQAEIMNRLGMPVGVGIASTKTLAKLASWAAKKWKAKTGCVLSLLDTERRDKLLKYAPVNEVWGIGSRLSKRLKEEMGIHTAWDLANADPKSLRRRFNVNVERTARELLGVPCFPFADTGPDHKKQMIACTRSFRIKITRLAALERAAVAFTTNAAEKLRRQNSLANCLQIYIRTSHFTSGPQYGNSTIVHLEHPTSDTRMLARAAVAGLHSIFREGYEYAKVGVVLSQFVEADGYTADLFAPAPGPESDALMSVMDAINTKYGRGALALGRNTGGGTGRMSGASLSPSYTTAWEGLQRANCK